MKENLYQKVKKVEGEKFITIEDTESLSTEEFYKFIKSLLREVPLNIEHLTILLGSEFPSEVEDLLSDNQFEKHDETVFYHCDLNQVQNKGGSFELKSLHKLSEEEFKQVWIRSAHGSLNAPGSLNIEDQMESVKKELGEMYKNTCIAAFKDGEAIGVVMPHIEPGTKEEGRFFYFGLVPEARGKGVSVGLYNQGLQLLKNDFGASYSVGATSVHNKPMIRVFDKNKCTLTKKVKVYKKTFKGRSK
ncbi:GNAT family N-acetyltransferase [Halobacillus yeomjeoni]|uniref:GNAT family N-acetyltransferase n=1 Tax=Halobacillus yeomjeoni TaxID=311194 RepID=A0A931MVI6_9BACI|nr:GNAT family N-acetyltransferase [Halobacillus yeomjeoni]MBH0230416.1 GNAT family N-acetyltransferase [Halobacillus yeomjeoni]